MKKINEEEKYKEEWIIRSNRIITRKIKEAWRSKEKKKDNEEKRKEGRKNEKRRTRIRKK